MQVGLSCRALLPALHSQRVGYSSSSRSSIKCSAQKNSCILQLRTAYTAPFGNSLLLVSEATGWSAEKAQPLSWSEGDIWTTELDVPSGKFEFKLAVRGGDGEVVAWQPGENRSIQVPADPAVLHVQVCWDGTPAVEVEQPASQGAAEPAVRAPAGEAAPGEKGSAEGSEAAVQPQRQPVQQVATPQPPKAVQAASRSPQKAPAKAATPILLSSLSKPLDELTVKELKDILKAAGLGVTGVKGILLTRLRDNLIEQ